MKNLLVLIAALSLPSAAFAQVELKAQVQVERQVTDASGKASVKLEDAAKAKVVPGDKLLFSIAYENASTTQADTFTVNNPIPAGVAFAGAESEGADFSVDGGKTFGSLSSLKITLADGSSRAALPADVTNIRWKFASAVPAGARGTLSFHAIVR